MNKGISEYEKFKVIRPMLGECKYDSYQIPIIRKTSMDEVNWNDLKAISLQNASLKTADKNTLIMMFTYDYKLMSIWNDPLKKIGLFQNFAAVSSPDFSISPAMNINMIRQYIFMSRWLGVTWQNLNCIVLPTAIWALPDTYDLCFSSIEFESVVVVSTLGCKRNINVFLEGFNEMKRRINPPLIIVYGDMINGMTGRFLHFQYTDSFRRPKKMDQMKIDDIPNIFEIKEIV